MTFKPATVELTRADIQDAVHASLVARGYTCGPVTFRYVPSSDTFTASVEVRSNPTPSSPHRFESHAFKPLPAPHLPGDPFICMVCGLDLPSHPEPPEPPTGPIRLTDEHVGATISRCAVCASHILRQPDKTWVHLEPFWEARHKAQPRVTR